MRMRKCRLISDQRTEAKIGIPLTVWYCGARERKGQIMRFDGVSNAFQAILTSLTVTVTVVTCQEQRDVSSSQFVPLVPRTGHRAHRVPTVGLLSGTGLLCWYP